MKANRSVAFFDTQFQRQVASGDYALNPFEKLAQPWLRGRVLDFGCGLGNLAIVNVLIEGTTFTGMFDPGNHYLFGRDELRDRFAGWKVLYHAFDSFDAPENTKKEFATIVAQR